MHFVTANGETMDGGIYGQFLELWLPLYKDERLITARTSSLFAYEAEIKNLDIVIGYPF